MAGKPQPRLKGWQKVVAALVVALILWQVLLSDTVSNAVLGFLLGGEVPGTNIVVSPQAMLWGIVAIVVLAVVVGVFRAAARRQRVRRLTLAEAETAKEIPAEEAASEEVAAELGPIVLEAEGVVPDFITSTEPEADEPETPPVVSRRTTWKRQLFAAYWRLRSQLKPLRKRLLLAAAATGRALQKLGADGKRLYTAARVQMAAFLVWVRPRLVRVGRDIRAASVEVVRQLGIVLGHCRRWLGTRLAKLEQMEVFREVKRAATSALQDTKQAAGPVVAKQKARTAKLVRKVKKPKKPKDKENKERKTTG